MSHLIIYRVIGRAVFVLTVLYSVVSATTLDEILERHCKAVGGRDNLEKVNTVRAVNDLVYNGYPARQTVYIKLPNHYRVDFELGGSITSSGYDGREGWLEDQNGLVRSMSAEEMKPLISGIYFDTYAYLIPGSISGRTEYVGDTVIEKSDYYYLHLMPTGGDTLSIFINQQTGLVDYMNDVSDGVRLINRFTDFRDCDGLIQPFMVEINSPDGPFDISAKVTDYNFNIDLPDSIFQRPDHRGNDINFPPDLDSLVLPVEIKNNHLIVETMVNGKGPFGFLLDTGVGGMSLSGGLADQLGIQSVGDIPASGMGGYGSYGLAQIDSLNLGQLSLYLTRINIVDLSSISGPGSEALDGILGYDLFARFAVRINTLEKRLVLYNPRFRPELSDRRRESLKIYQQVPVVDAIVNNQPIRLLVDLGAASGLIIRNNARLYSSLVKPKDGESVAAYVRGIGGQQKVNVIAIGDLRLAGEDLTDLNAFITEDFKTLPLPEYIEGVVGMEILGKYDIYLDYGAGVISLQGQEDRR